uniref:Counting factor associated protein D n=2 Tax=Lygus hesperus TaxID=30085 RepID=A0A0K8T3S5_LYGHE
MFEVMKEIIVLLVGTIAWVSATSCDVSSPPLWPKAYSVRGAISIPYTELYEPFQAWYDEKTGNSRIDYYDGMAKTFQLSSWPSKNGSMVKIVPVTTDDQMNRITCLKTEGEAAGEVTPQSILPDLSDFKCVGKGVINGIQAEQWSRVEQDEEKTSEYIMWIKWKNYSTGSKIAVPVYYEMKGYNSLLGSHYDHYYLSYQAYNPTAPAKSVWRIPSTQACTNLGLGVGDVATFNPMKEFVHNYDHHINQAWDNFVKKHKREYNEQSEHALRKYIFKQNHRFIHSHNRADHGYKLALNHLADRTDGELKALRGRKITKGSNGGSPFPYKEEGIQTATQTLPIDFDWRLYGAVNPVKDQSICGSCWSFGTTGTIEGAYFVKTGKLISLSEQALVDCSWGYGNNGCDGGLDYTSYEWIMKHGGIPLEEEYGPYLAMDGRCHSDKVKLVAPITGWVNVTAHNERALKLSIFKHGPVSIAINASLKTFSFYSNGVYYDPKCKGGIDDLDHAVLAVGYGWLNHKKYWLVKNSWSNHWGNDGYILMQIKNNNCGVMTSPTYVTM